MLRIDKLDAVVNIYINELGEEIMATLDEVLAKVDEVQATVTAEKAEVALKLKALTDEIIALKDKIASGAGVTAADLDGVIGKLGTIATSVSTISDGD